MPNGSLELTTVRSDHAGSLRSLALRYSSLALSFGVRRIDKPISTHGPSRYLRATTFRRPSPDFVILAARLVC